MLLWFGCHTCTLMSVASNDCYILRSLNMIKTRREPKVGLEHSKPVFWGNSQSRGPRSQRLRSRGPNGGKVLFVANENVRFC